MEQLLSLTSEPIDKEHFEELLNIVTERYDVTLDQIIESRNQIEISDNMYYALDMLMIDPFKWYNKDITRKESTLDINFVNHLKKYTCQFNEIKCRNTEDAAINGHLECLKYLHENGCPWNEDMCRYASNRGHLECLKYLHENGCSWDEETCAFAAINGKLECLKYAHENGCPWDEWTCKYAAKIGNLECLKYARENGCPWNVETCSSAAKKGHLECLKYARENGCPASI